MPVDCKTLGARTSKLGHIFAVAVQERGASHDSQSAENLVRLVLKSLDKLRPDARSRRPVATLGPTPSPTPSSIPPPGPDAWSLVQPRAVVVPVACPNAWSLARLRAVLRERAIARPVSRPRAIATYLTASKIGRASQLGTSLPNCE